MSAAPARPGAGPRRQRGADGRDRRRVPRPRHRPGPARLLPAPLRPPVPRPPAGPPHHVPAPGGEPVGGQARALAAAPRDDGARPRGDADRQHAGAGLPLRSRAPLPRLPRPRRVRYDALAHQTYYGLRLHLRVAWPGVITAATLAPANEADLAVAPQLLAGLAGWALGDKGYWSPALRAELAPGGLDLIAPPRGKSAGA